MRTCVTRTRTTVAQYMECKGDGKSSQNKASPTLSYPITRPIQIPDHTTDSNSATAFPSWSRSSPRQFYSGFRSISHRCRTTSIDGASRSDPPLSPRCLPPLDPVSFRSLPLSLDNPLNSSLISYYKNRDPLGSPP